ncbi:hypothetical protein LTS18_013689, partial [Coniosporium uncinatum]
MTAKRKRAGKEPGNSTPKKARYEEASEDELGEHTEVVVTEEETPSRRQRGTVGVLRSAQKAKANGNASPLHNGTATPKSLRKVLFSTPAKKDDDISTNDTPALVRTADRSARRKSNRRLIERTLNSGGQSDEEASEDEEAIAQRIWADEDGEEEQEDEGDALDDALPDPDTPSKS